MIQIDVPSLPAASLNPNARSHYRAKNKAKQALIEIVTESAQIACGLKGVEWVRAAGFPWTHVTIAVTWRYYGTARPDADNCLSMLKSAFDALVRSGVLGDDRDVVHLPMSLQKAVNRDDSGFSMRVQRYLPDVCPLCLRAGTEAIPAIDDCHKQITESQRVTNMPDVSIDAQLATVSQFKGPPWDGRTFHHLGLLWGDLQRTPGRLDKVKKLELALRHDEGLKLAGLFHAALDPFRVFYVTAPLLQRLLPSVHNNHPDWKLPDDLRPFFIALQQRALSRQDAVNLFHRITRDWSPTAINAAWALLDKDPSCGVNAKTLNPVLVKIKHKPVPEFHVALGEVYAGQPVWEDEEDWYMSRKLDGVRSLVMLCPGKAPTHFSRPGLPQFNLGALAEPLQAIIDRIDRPLVLDAEVCLQNGDKDDFSAIQGAMNKKNYTIPNPRLHVFDVIPEEAFLAGYSPHLMLYDRQMMLCDLLPEDTDFLRRVRQVLVTDEDIITNGMLHAEKNKWEGLMLRRNAVYRGKRCNDIFKVKGAHDIELVAHAVEMGEKMMKGEKRPCLAAVICGYKNGTVRVGGGWSDQQRLAYHAIPAGVIGRTLKVQYTQESVDKNGKPSLRFPRVKHVFGVEGRVD